METINMALVRMYANLVINGRRKIGSIPTVYKTAVQAEIDKHPV